MAYHSKTYSLSDDVVEAIERAKAGGTSPNRFFRQLMGLDGGEANTGENPENGTPVVSIDPATIPGVTRGITAANEGERAPLFWRDCAHCGKKFETDLSRSVTCGACAEKGHSKGGRYDCEECRLES